MYCVQFLVLIMLISNNSPKRFFLYKLEENSKRRPRNQEMQMIEQNLFKKIFHNNRLMICIIRLTKEFFYTKSKLIVSDLLTLVFSAVSNKSCLQYFEHTFFIANEIIADTVNDAQFLSFPHMPCPYFLSSLLIVVV